MWNRRYRAESKKTNKAHNNHQLYLLTDYISSSKPLQSKNPSVHQHQSKVQTKLRNEPILSNAFLMELFYLCKYLTQPQTSHFQLQCQYH